MDELQVPQQTEKAPDYNEAKQFSIGFLVDLPNNKIGILTKQAWEPKYTLWQVSANMILRLAAEYTLGQIDMAEQMMEKLRERKAAIEAERRAPAKKFDAAGNVVEAEVVPVDDTVAEVVPAPNDDPSFEVPAVQLGE